MKKLSRYSITAAFAACGALMTPSVPVWAAPQETRPVRQGVDLLITQGSLQGRLLDANGKPVAGAPVFVSKNGRTIASTSTQANGAYRVAGLSAGAHTIVIADGQIPVRLWTAETAPTSAKRQLTVSQTAVRGQFVDAAGEPIWGNVAIGVVAAAALAVAIVNTSKLSDLDDDLDNLQSP